MLVPLTFETVLVDDEPALREWHELRVAAHLVDHPAYPPDRWEHVLGDVRVPVPTYRDVLRLARDADGRPVAAMRHWLGDAGNTDVDQVRLDVHPAMRRRGIGGACLDDLRGIALGDRRTRMLADVIQPMDSPAPGAAFATGAGARLVLAEVWRLLDLTRVDHDRLRELRKDAEAHAAGYRVVQWAGDVPDELVDGFARLRTQLAYDVPLGDLEWQPERFDADRVRAGDEANRARGRVRVATAAVHVESGEVVAYTDIGTYVLPGENAFQWDTLVLRAHRGHRLGLLIKVANLELLREQSPQARYLRSLNAADNAHMIAINDALGFVPVERTDQWQLDL